MARRIGAAYVARNVARHLEKRSWATGLEATGRWSTAGAAASARTRWR
ncbi:MAG: hypothetical protein QM753_12810 [Thermomicrobiales bacterium]